MNVSKRLRLMIQAALFAALTAVGAYIAIPLQVPITFQTVGTLISGVLLGPLWGAISQLVYIFIGVSGIPVFAGGSSGFSVLLGPTGGYLAGFVCASAVAGIICLKERSVARVITALVSATMVIYVCGVIWLSIFFDISLYNAMISGCFPFIIGDLLKIFISYTLIVKLDRTGVLK